ncbi:MAG: hypothetical protein ACRELB_20810 [Polyangiaceae bacterium]
MPDPFRFLVDEAALRLSPSTTPSELGETLERLADLIEGLRAHRIGKFSMIWEEQLGPHALYEWLFNPLLGIDVVVASALRVALDRTPNWDEACDTAGFPTQVTIGGIPHDAFSVGAAARATCDRQATGCLSVLPSRHGRVYVIAGVWTPHLHFVAHPRDIFAFFREVPEVDNLDEEAYFQNARLAFPGLLFVRARTDFGAFDEAYLTIRAKVTEHLGVLNDHARAILGGDEPAAVKEGRFGALGVEASGENANTKANHAAMKQREVNVGDRAIVCDWHTKLRPHIDRIYFNATSYHQVVVGVFRDHLD